MIEMTFRRPKYTYFLITCNVSINNEFRFFVKYISFLLKKNLMNFLNFISNRVVYQWKHVAILEHVNSIQELNVYQVHVVLVVNYFHQDIHVVHLEIRVTYLKFAMAFLPRYLNHKKITTMSYSFFSDSVS